MRHFFFVSGNYEWFGHRANISAPLVFWNHEEGVWNNCLTKCVILLLLTRKFIMQDIFFSSNFKKCQRYRMFHLTKGTNNEQTSKS